MKYYFFAVLALSFISCNHADTKKPDAVAAVPEEKPNFIRVTSYILGQIREIPEKGMNPIKYTTINGKTDSVILKFEELNETLKEFLSPKIDSANLAPFFKEAKFLDQTINEYTFSYDRNNTPLPDSIKLLRWDLYVDPQTGNIKRVYMVKKSGENKTLQLLWESNEWCKITTLSNEGDSSKVEKEEKISWKY